MKADRNKTIDLTVEKGKKYLDRCIVVSQQSEIPSILDKTILGDAFSVLPLLPENSVDLLIVDPHIILIKTLMARNSKRQRTILTKNIPRHG